MCGLPARLTTFCIGLFFILVPGDGPLQAQKGLAGAAEVRQAIDRLQVLGSVLMVAAHPDDENTALLAYFARERKLRTAYLSLTRGEGGQNLIGPEQNELLGVIRTQELLAARRIDGAEQYFTRAIDFGFSKSADETLAKWGRQAALGDVVWVIRRFRPDVIVLRFSGTPRDGHGHHQSSAILAREAFEAAADPKRFPEQLAHVQSWRTRRVVFNTFAFTREQEAAAEKAPDRVEIDTGTFDPVLGYSYSEIAGMSRSQHRSQGMGAPERRGSQKNYLTHVAGEAARADLFDGVDTSWRRVGGEAAGAILAEAARTLDLARPDKTIPKLLEARALIRALPAPDAMRKLEELDEALALCAGLWLDASADAAAVSPGDSLRVTATALNRSGAPAGWNDIELEGVPGAPRADAGGTPLEPNRPATRLLTVTVPLDHRPTQPYWLDASRTENLYGKAADSLAGLAEAPAVLRARFRLTIHGQVVEIVRPVVRRYVDRVQGELTRPVVVAPAVSLRLPVAALVFASDKPRSVEVAVRSQRPQARGEVRLIVPDGWRVTPVSRAFELSSRGEQVVAVFEVTPPPGAARGALRATATVGGVDVDTETQEIDYPHIPPQTVFRPAVAKLARAEIRTLARRVGYVMGAGDEVPEALRQIGCEVTLLDASALARGDLDGFDAIVTGVRAYNTRADLRANQQRLLDWVSRGGTMVVQYNVLEGGPFGGGDPSLLARIGPFPLSVGRERVSVEESPVEVLKPNHPLLSKPNQISAADFDGWVQERGLYFASQWDPRYETLLECHDPGEKRLEGGLLYTRVGKGAYVFTAHSWFRQLPAGVEGAYRIFANLLSAAKSAGPATQ